MSETKETLPESLVGWRIVLNMRGYQVGKIHPPQVTPWIEPITKDKAYRLEEVKEQVMTLEALSHTPEQATSEDYIIINSRRFQVGGKLTLVKAQKIAAHYNRSCANSPHVVYKLVELTKDDQTVTQSSKMPHVGMYITLSKKGFQVGDLCGLEEALRRAATFTDKVYKLEEPVAPIDAGDNYVIINRSGFQMFNATSFAKASESAASFTKTGVSKPYLVYKLVEVTDKTTGESTIPKFETPYLPYVPKKEKKDLYVIRNPQGYMSGKFDDLETAKAYTAMCKGKLFKWIKQSIPGFPPVKLEEVKDDQEHSA